ncbi:putative carboxypeptidase s precursor [Kockovaella imperatae]|uniref:Putative carboxypeptidase s n=1 Tax=Kockovaella imperatae TaxID=4999 RepID=A0A1Y1USK4_9TREE|nr:putative carboxypeptidase s precursor [Kockovaella imperatae]ORX40185.1 putative carboxypeptidase s precursor [Kockovaella imperatae]
MSKTDTAPLLPHGSSTRGTTSKRSLALVLSLFALVALLTPSPLSILSATISSIASLRVDAKGGSCDQADPLMPSLDQHNTSSVRSFKDRIIKWHQGVIRIPTFVFDEMGEPGEDPKWEIFHDLHRYLEQSYPLVHEHLKLTKVDTIGLVYEWIGSDTSLQPLMLTAHQDVVPVLPETLYQWQQPPFEGVYDGKYIWGRGSSDDKSGLTSILAAIELLLETSDFKPRRTVVLGFGHDEERGGQRGAPAIRDWLLETYGRDSMALLVDEGSGLSYNWGRRFALPAVAEKGKHNLNMTVSTLGGHSSIPPKHTNIGLTSLLIAELEKNPHQPMLEQSSPIWGYLQCASRYAPEIPRPLKRSVAKSQGSMKAFKRLPQDIIEHGLGTKPEGKGQGKMAEAIISTTQAADIMHAGFKINALPEVSEVMVNHRINIHSSVKDVQKHIIQTLRPIAEQLDLTLSAWGQEYHPKGETRGTVYLSDAYEVPHGPAPITPTSMDNAAWRVFAGTSRGMWASRAEVSEDGSMVHLEEDDQLVVAPFMGTGNTDTRRYWDLTRNIYRFRYFPDDDSQGAHTINEKVDADAIVEFTRYYQALILNVDASTEL